MVDRCVTAHKMLDIWLLNRYGSCFFVMLEVEVTALVTEVTLYETNRVSATYADEQQLYIVEI